ncbi:DUF4142 domain-containing protein [Flavobacterium sp.]|uniref:DUF4142 domain-containing protein n=1 Tax=Flavobacterium sp. TaxID=239 RepID=UPI00121E1D93|nr:DUF4142 domain-containing protein [Flavobacterium sp.]RZJ72193.1 MAG: DUF4142 domain-containing protein [Flavobacterium sp.]
MKNSFFYKLCAMSMLLLGAMTFTVQSCDTKDKSTDTEKVAEKANEEKFDNATTGVESEVKKEDSDFLMSIAETDMKEVELGKLAQKSTRSDVQAVATMMVETHSQTARDIKAIAVNKGISIPKTATEDIKEEVADFNEKPATDFDKAYADNLVAEHEEVIKKFEDYVKEGTDADIKSWAEKMLPTLKNHLEHAKVIQARVS